MFGFGFGWLAHIWLTLKIKNRGDEGTVGEANLGPRADPNVYKSPHLTACQCLPQGSAKRLELSVLDELLTSLVIGDTRYC